MRAGIRQHLIDTIPELKDCYEPTVPTKDTIKPYAVILQSDDTNNGNVVGFKRTIEIWIYKEETSFVELDSLTEKVIKALNMQVIEDTTENETFTCVFGGAIGEDQVDKEWDAIARGLRFTVIALHEEDEINTDSWLDALKEYTNTIMNFTVYLNTWKKNFKVPSILWRVKSSNKERLNNTLIKESKTLICHIASNNNNEINKLLDNIEDNLITAFKIPLDLADKRYLTIESISEDREADMLSKGQLTVEFSRLKMIQDNTPTINKIYARGKVEEE